MDRAKLDDYLGRGKALFDGELIDGETIDDREGYKARVFENLARAREAVLAGDDGWLDLVERGITIPRGSPIFFVTRIEFLSVSASRPGDALRALRMLWMEGDARPAERIRAFFDAMPPEYEETWTRRKAKVWTRLSLVALLLMALGPEYPPVMKSRFTRVWDSLEPPGLPRTLTKGKRTSMSWRSSTRSGNALMRWDTSARGIALRRSRSCGRCTDSRRRTKAATRTAPDVVGCLGHGAEGRHKAMNEAKLDAYLKRGKQLFDGELIEGRRNGKPVYETLDERESYKEKIVLRLHEARDAVLAGKDDWPALVKRGLANNLAGRWGAMTIRNWVDRQPEAARAVLREFWAEGDTPPEERIRVFVDNVPPHAWGGAGGAEAARTRLRMVSALLMALPEGYPPYKATEFNRTYKHMDYEILPSQDEGEIYKHAMEFLDRLLERKEALGYERPRDRRDAQSLLWTMNGFLKNGEIMPPPKNTNNSDPLEALAKKLLLPPKFLREITDLLEDKKQIIFQGPPGTGKTFVARELAKFLAGSEDRVRVVQFHPSYAYEDFVQGFRPTTIDEEKKQVGFELCKGPLLQMADQAASELNERHFLVIDEINRGNLSKILGELYYLLEYRADDDEADDDDFVMQLQYSDAPFAMPPNLYIIGTMNTADRSIALVDAALRRRFYFVPFHPAEWPIEGLLGRYLDEKKVPSMGGVAKFVEEANEKLGDQRRDAAIGPSYFMKENLNQEMADRIWKYNVLPYLEEQLYGESATLTEIKALWTGANADSDETEPGDGEQGNGED